MGMRHIAFYATRARRLCAPACAHLALRRMLRAGAQKRTRANVCGQSPLTSTIDVDGA